MTVSVLPCQIPQAVRYACLQWYSGRNSNMYRLATTGMFNPEKLLAEAEKEIATVAKRDEERELIAIKEYAESLILRDAAESALQKAAEKVVFSSHYSYADAVEYFRLCFLEYSKDGY